MLKFNLKSETDRSLLIGILDRKKNIIPQAAKQRLFDLPEDSEEDEYDPGSRNHTMSGPNGP